MNSMQPILQVRPLRPAVAADAATTVDLLITVEAPSLPAEPLRPRPPLNLALVIDRSGSMSGEKLSYARKAARFLASELTARDRLAIVTFDDEVNVLVPSQPVQDPKLFIKKINTIHSGSSTALFDGWLAGATQVANHLDNKGLNRVLLLSDGEANQGLVDAGEIAEKVAGLSQLGISTSAFGLGRGFDEDLMGAIARAGDGTLAQIESPAQLADLYASELDDLARTLGKKVSLGIRAKRDVQLLDVINDFELTSSGNWQLPNLRHGKALTVAARFQLPPWQANREIVSLRLAWRQPGSNERRSFVAHITLPVMAAVELAEMDPDPVVTEQFALLQANRDRTRVIEAMDCGDLRFAREQLALIDQRLALLQQTEAIQGERRLLEQMKGMMDVDLNLSRKRLRRESLRSSMSVWEPSSDPDESNDDNLSVEDRLIPNEQLKLSDIPNMDDRYWEWVKFAHTIKGYDVAGSLDACAKIAERVRELGDGSLTELRCTLFLESRAERHSGVDADAAWIRHLIRAIRTKVSAGQID